MSSYPVAIGFQWNGEDFGMRITQGPGEPQPSAGERFDSFEKAKAAVAAGRAADLIDGYKWPNEAGE